MRQWTRVSKAHPCPICKKPDWCIMAPDGTAVICPRTESGRYIDGSGYLHTLKNTRHWIRETILATKDPEALPEHNGVIAKLAEQCCDERLLYALADEATKLGLQIEALRSLGCGWFGSGRALSIPMRRMSGGVIGLRFRDRSGRKWSAKGSKNGLFIPSTFDPTRSVVVVEGPTDTAACLGIGLNAIGLASSCMSWRIVAEAIVDRRAVFVLDNDGRNSEAGKHVARLAMQSAAYAKEVRVVLCPVKDMREWIVSESPTKAEFAAFIKTASVVVEPESRPGFKDINDLLDHLYSVTPLADGVWDRIENLQLDLDNRPTNIRYEAEADGLLRVVIDEGSQPEAAAEA